MSFQEMLDRGELPTKDGIFMLGGNAYSVDLYGYPVCRIEKNGWFNLDEFIIENSDEITHIDLGVMHSLSNHCFCQVGEGGYGSEGFLIYYDEHKLVKWVLYFEESNPFVSAELRDGCVFAKTSSNLCFSLDPQKPFETISLC